MVRWGWLGLVFAFACAGLVPGAGSRPPAPGPLDPELARIGAMPPGESVLHDLAIFERDHHLAPAGCADAIRAFVEGPAPNSLAELLPTEGCTDACGVGVPPTAGDAGIEDARTVVLRACDARGPDPLFQGPLANARAGVAPTTYVVVRTLIAPLIAQGRWSPALARTIALSVLMAQSSHPEPIRTFGRTDLGPAADALADCPARQTRAIVDESGHIVPNVEQGPAAWCSARAEREVALPPGDVGVIDYEARMRRPLEERPPGAHRLRVTVEGVVTGVLPMSTGVQVKRLAGDTAWSVVAPAADDFGDHLVGPRDADIRPALIVSQERQPTEIQLSHVLPGLWDFVGTADGVLAPGTTVVAKGRWRFAGDPTDTLKWVGVTPSGLVVRDEGEGTVTVQWIE